MKLKLFLIIFVLILPLAYSQISIKNLKEAYNLGEDIHAELGIKSESSFTGFQQAEIICDSYSMVYSVSPVNIPSNLAFISFLPSLSAFKQMKGNCRIKITIESIDKSIEEQKTSDEFIVSDNFRVDLNYNSLSLNPSDTLALTGALYNIRDEPISGILKATLDNQFQNFAIINSTFSISMKIPADIPSGEQKLLLTFEDNKGNYIDRLLKLNILPRPSSISIKLDDDIYLPYEELKAELLLLDQANATLNGEMVIKIIKEKKEIYSINRESGILAYLLNTSLQPGEYIISASYSNLSKEAVFEIASLQQIETRIENQTVIITNTGNVEYRNSTPITISGNEQSVSIEKRVSLDPGESAEIDLSKEVPEGNYSIELPTGVKQEGVHIDDNRNMIKKTASGLSMITGSVIKTMEENNVIFSFIIFFIVVLVGVAVLQYLGYPIVDTLKDSAKSVYKKIRKK